MLWVWCIPLRFAWRKRPLTASLPALQNTGSNRRSTLNCLPYLIWASQSSEQSMGLYYFITHTLWSGFWKQGLVLAQAALEFTVLLHWPVKYRYKCAPLQLLLHTLNVMRFLKTMTSRGVGPFFYCFIHTDFLILSHMNQNIQCLLENVLISPHF